MSARVGIAASAVVLAFAAAPVAAQPSRSPAERARAEKIYKEGLRHYNVGEYAQAIARFKESYLISAAPLLLFNIGQAYRLAGNCKQAILSYNAYLRESTDEAIRAQVDAAIEKCRATVAEEDTQPQPEPPASADPPASSAQPAPIAHTDAALPVAERRTLLVARLGLGPAFASIGEVEPGLLVTVAAGVGFPIPLGRLEVEPGIAATYTPVAWDSDYLDGTSGRAGLTGLLVNWGVALPLSDRLRARAELGGGLLVLSGVDVDGNPFLEEDEMADGALMMWHVRGGAGLELTVSRSTVLHVQPVVSYSPPRDLRGDISAITRLDLLIGAGIRL
ncbi:MAG TPA: hypothetical protein VMZ28_11985 [Kofleriaceae bacterium]|nr:hypothetical protein [Kofleriaceae bacterium]